MIFVCAASCVISPSTCSACATQVTVGVTQTLRPSAGRKVWREYRHLGIHF